MRIRNRDLGFLSLSAMEIVGFALRFTRGLVGLVNAMVQKDVEWNGTKRKLLAFRKEPRKSGRGPPP